MKNGIVLSKNMIEIPLDPEEQDINRHCFKCGEDKDDVEVRYSYGVYVGRTCTDCAMTYRDHCGIDQDQGSPAELEAMGETYWEEEN